MTEEQARKHLWVLAGTHVVHRSSEAIGGWRINLKRSKEFFKNRNNTENARAARLRYQNSERGRILQPIHSLKYKNKLADARDDALLLQLRSQE